MAPPLRVIWTRRAACGKKPAMSEPSRAKPKKPAKDRAAKLKAALRENLKRRKAQARARDKDEGS